MTNEQEEIDEFKRYEFLAENGHPTFQYFFSAAINAKDYYPERLVQSLKWALLAQYFEEPQAVDVVMFLQHKMTEEQIQKSYLLVEEWISGKFEITEEKEKAAWSQHLRAMIEGK